MTIHKSVANWLPNRKLLLKQIFLSAWSYITLPFSKNNQGGVQNFFHQNYYHEPDGLIFDGSNSFYFSRLFQMVDVNGLKEKTIVDLGCGKATLYIWMMNHKISFMKYVGIDFAVDSKVLCEGSQIIQSSIMNINNFNHDGDCLFFLSNVICFLTIDELRHSLSNLSSQSEVLIIEPSPGLFWDAHFNGIHPVYRSIESLTEILNNEGIRIVNSMQDYMVKCLGTFCFPMSYCLYGVKK